MWCTIRCSSAKLGFPMPHRKTSDHPWQGTAAATWWQSPPSPCLANCPQEQRHQLCPKDWPWPTRATSPAWGFLLVPLFPRHLSGTGWRNCSLLFPRHSPLCWGTPEPLGHYLSRSEAVACGTRTVGPIKWPVSACKLDPVPSGARIAQHPTGSTVWSKTEHRAYGAGWSMWRHFE